MTTRPLSSITLVASLTTAILYTGCGHPAPPPRTTRIVTPAPVVVKVANEPQTVAVQKPPQPGRSVPPAPEPPPPAPPPPALLGGGCGAGGEDLQPSTYEPRPTMPSWNKGFLVHPGS